MFAGDSSLGAESIEMMDSIMVSTCRPPDAFWGSENVAIWAKY